MHLTVRGERGHSTDKRQNIFTSLLQGKSIPKLGTLDQIETGSGDAYSGDCDDEDGCWGSGNGAPERRRIVTICK
ncbi:hypothetical protein QQF64_001625 [Cirrhinus molitorella]|uniref:Uncharacterized protein n=1 Tax=Cirrhinus molitorella TaxID=172907 RepID=A0ABR3P126_9TELE